MTFIPEVHTNALVLGNGDESSFTPVVRMELDTNNVKPYRSQNARLAVRFQKNFPAEIEIEPGPECISPEGSSIISELMLWGRATPDGKGRGRITLQINVDSNGGQYALLDSSTNDPSGSVGQSRAMPIGINVGEAKGQYVFLYPDGRIKLSTLRGEYWTTMDQVIEQTARGE